MKARHTLRPKKMTVTSGLALPPRNQRSAVAGRLLPPKTPLRSVSSKAVDSVCMSHMQMRGHVRSCGIPSATAVMCGEDDRSGSDPQANTT